MIETRYLQQPAQVRVQEGYARRWQTLWLVRKPVWRLIFAGYIDNLSWGRSMNAPDTLSISLESAEARLMRTEIVVERDESA